MSQLSLLHQQITPDEVREVTGAISETDLLRLLQAIHQSDTYRILQIARGLIDSGRAPQLILTSLLQVYRDLLIVKGAAKSQNLLQGGISYRRLSTLARKFDFATINAAFCQLHKSESQLKTTLKAAVWLEVCLLNLGLFAQRPEKVHISLADSLRRTKE
jgi:DNA polymerase-3 subunit gamma/tau